MTFSPDDIEIKEFVPTLRGYDRAEVRAYLRAVADDVRRLEERLNEREAQGTAEQADAAPRERNHAAIEPSRLDVPLRANESTPLRELEHAVRDLTFAIRAIAARTGLIERATHRMASTAADPTSAPAPAAALAGWAGEERRGPSRPWARRDAGADTGPESVDWSLPEVRRPGVRDRDAENRAMIERFLAPALGAGEPVVALGPPRTEPAETAAEGGAVLPFVRAV